MATDYRASVALAITLANRASSTSLVTGRCSPAHSNAVNKDDFLLPALRFRTGSTAPTAGTQLEIWAFTQRADGLWPELFTTVYTGLDGDFTITSREVLDAGAVRIGSYTFDAAVGRDVVIRGREIANAFGGAVPQDIGFWVTQGSNQNLDGNASNFALTLRRGVFT